MKEGRTALNDRFQARARAIFISHGLDPENSDYAAVWAAEVTASGRDIHGIVVDTSGEIVAETVFTRGPGHAGVAYVTQAGTERFDLRGNEIGLALGQIKKAHGDDVAHIKLSELGG